MTDIILNALVVTVTLSTIVSAKYRVTERQTKKRVYGTGYVVVSAVTSFSTLGLWIVLAFVTGQWQFAAMVVIPFSINLSVYLASEK